MKTLEGSGPENLTEPEFIGSEAAVNHKNK